MLPPRRPLTSEIPQIARLWHDGWHDAHDRIVPAELSAARGLEMFTGRLMTMADRLRVAGPPGACAGLCAVDADELDQLFVAPGARGTGVAAMLLADGEARIRAAGHGRAWLTAARGNRRAAAFYRREGWTEAGVETAVLDLGSGKLELPVLVFEKTLAA